MKKLDLTQYDFEQPSEIPIKGRKQKDKKRKLRKFKEKKEQ